MTIIKRLGTAIEALFLRVFRKTALCNASLQGRGYVERAGGDERLPFVMRGEPTDRLLREAMAGVARALYGPLAGGPFSRMRGAVTHPTAVRTAVADLVVDRLDAGSGAGTLEFQTSGSAEVATLTFSDPAFGAASSGTATASAITSDTTATGGTVTKFVAQDSDGTDVFLGAVSTSGSDINLSSVAVGAADTVAVSSLTYSAMP